MRWVLASPGRLYGTFVGALVAAVVLTGVIVAVRLTTGEPAAPRSDVVATPTPRVEVLEDVVREAVEGETRRIKVAAKDGLMTVVHVAMVDGRFATVVLFSDGPTYVVDEVQWRSD